MRIEYVFALVLPFHLLAASCGEPGLDEPDTGFEAYAEALCSKAFECRPLFPDDTLLDFEDAFGNDAAACQVLVGDPALVTRAVETGGIIYRPERLTACIAGVEAASCREFWTDPSDDLLADCQGAFEGTRGYGDACTISYECVEFSCDDNQCGGGGSDPPPDSCFGHCGDAADSCFCDDACVAAGDCCPDYQSECL